MIIRTIHIARTTLDPARFPRAPWPEIAVSGRSNVGKSSLLNALLGRKKLAGVSKDPGKTRSVNFYGVNDRFYLVDLPGYGFAHVSAELRSRWIEVICRYLVERGTLAGVVQLIDSRHPPTKDDVAMIAHIQSSGRPFCVALTKADKISRADRARALRDIVQSAGEAPVVFFSARTGEGREDIWRWIDERI